MTDQEYDLLKRLYRQATKIKNDIEAIPWDEEGARDIYTKLKSEFDKLDIVSELISTSQRKALLEDKIKRIKQFISLKSNGTVFFEDKILVQIIEKAIL